ncbi:hypothetical protein DFO70_11771 [Cytobacillus firmus]|uniref:Uncharacterized protein n=2 Tax=Cytobacillus TaxID=2675230 RepID=A0A366JNF9_CYTFI|nr:MULTISPECIES: hypothetical protein [Cytobacillus]RBP87880.1 hypothetical protein DFO70_11771 [Cytobacillus firmus]TDX39243.1 hypothetical protein DFO72_11173 [Cytobacillus oceanisediminis]
MEIVDFSPVKDTLDKIAVQLITLMAMCALAYIGAFIVLRLIKIPGQLAHYISTAVLLVVMYYSFVNGYIPGIQSAQ